jgi:hypothetical protein
MVNQILLNYIIIFIQQLGFVFQASLWSWGRPASSGSGIRSDQINWDGKMGGQNSFMDAAGDAVISINDFERVAPGS